MNLSLSRTVAWRRHQLERLRDFVQECESKLLQALKQDLGKSSFEAYTAEIGLVQMEIKHALHNLASWIKPKPVKTPLVHMPGKSYIVPEPLGTVLIMGPWNYPAQLILSPLVGAIAAGNCVVLKPSELAPHTAALLSEFLPRYLDTECIRVVSGDAEVSQELLKQKWDHIFFTGSSSVGRLVMQAAAQNLTPVTLELGGKCPCIIDEQTDISLAARRVAWGKFANAGQTCVAPDYVLVHEKVRERFVQHLSKSIVAFYGDDAKWSADYGRIINARHFDRLVRLIKDQNVVFGGEYDMDTLYFSPTLVHEPGPNSALMQEEIFGPILPILSFDNFEEAIHFVNVRDKALSLYLFSSNLSHMNLLQDQTSSGALVFNDTLSHVANPYLPFGGVGSSGMGQYHGEASFKVFSHEKSVFSKSTHIDVPVRYPPYSEVKLKIARHLLG